MTNNQLNITAQDMELQNKAVVRAVQTARFCRNLAKTSASNSPAFWLKRAREALAGGRRARSSAKIAYNSLIYYAANPHLIEG